MSFQILRAASELPSSVGECPWRLWIIVLPESGDSATGERGLWSAGGGVDGRFEVVRLSRLALSSLRGGGILDKVMLYLVIVLILSLIHI